MRRSENSYCTKMRINGATLHRFAPFLSSECGVIGQSCSRGQKATSLAALCIGRMAARCGQCGWVQDCPAGSATAASSRRFISATASCSSSDRDIKTRLQTAQHIRMGCAGQYVARAQAAIARRNCSMSSRLASLRARRYLYRTATMADLRAGSN